MEDTLQIKHLAPYLPYGLEYLSPAYDHGMILGSKTETIEEMGVVSMMSMIQSNGRLKPLLHPLSRLTEPILEDGKTPEQWFKEQDSFGDFFQEYSEMKDNIATIPFRCGLKLFQWHFDVFGLIEKGLALEKPIKV